ncbi:hypothetical protein R3P38DRAFT_3219479 [Favolaschia claudopus]|uniref:Uncharacterized protein n=1 Tax=Favolaschia claudopus TaxID=2862362 RepID=A0AAW0A2A6_9AGAR
MEVIARQDTIKRVRWSDKVEDYLRQFDWNQLFSTTLRTRMAAMNVARFISETIDEPFLRQVPELKAKVAAHRLNPSHEGSHDSLVLVCRRLMQLSERDLSPDDAQLRRDLLQYAITHMLSLFDLRYGDVKLMQAATGTLISGSFIAALIQRSFTPNDLDFFCGHDRTESIVRYFQNQLDCTFTVDPGDVEGYGNVHGVHRMTTLTTSRGNTIQIIESYSELPLELILNFHSAPTRGVVSANGFSHYEIRRARNGLALVTPDSLLIKTDDLDSQIVAWKILHKYKQRGVTFIFEYNVLHECGKHVECPATLRDTSDDGCLHVALPTIPIPNFSASDTPIFTWSLGPVGMCSTGRVNGRQVAHTRSFQHIIFRKLVTALMQIPAVPESPIRVHPWSDYWSTDGSADSDSE